MNTNREEQESVRTYLESRKRMTFIANAYSEEALESETWSIVPGLELTISDSNFGDYSMLTSPNLAIHVMVWIPAYEAVIINSDKESIIQFAIDIDGHHCTYWTAATSSAGRFADISTQYVIEKPLPVEDNPFCITVRCKCTNAKCQIPARGRQLVAFVDIVDKKKKAGD